MATRRGLGSDPTKREKKLIPTSADEAGEKRPAETREDAPQRPQRKNLTLTIPLDLYNRIRGAAYALAGPPERLTVVGLVSRSVEAELERLEAEHNDGERFPPPPEELRRGSRPGA